MKRWNRCEHHGRVGGRKQESGFVVAHPGELLWCGYV